MKGFVMSGSVMRRGATRSRPLFGRMYEDCTLECSQFSPGGRVFCIASAGCTALALASQGRRVDAVDINPANVEYVKQRLAGGGRLEGGVDRLFQRVRSSASWIGPGREETYKFLMLKDTQEQLSVWHSRFSQPFIRRLMDVALSRTLLRLFYRSGFVQMLPARFGETIRRRFERGLALHPNHSNPYLWNLLLGCDPPDLAPQAPITIVPRVLRADAAEFLEASPYIYDAFSLSNILDGATETYYDRLLRAVRRTAAPGAVVILRSFLEPNDAAQEHDASLDRSMLWGRVQIHRLRDE